MDWYSYFMKGFQIQRYVFLSIKWLISSIKLASVKKKKKTFPPTPKSLFLEIVHNIRGSCAALHDDRFTNFIF